MKTSLATPRLAGGAAATTDAGSADPAEPSAAESIDSAMDIAERYATARPAQVEPVLSTAPAAAAASGLEDVDLTGAPDLKPVKKLRARQRVTLWKAMLSLQKRLEGREQDGDGTVEVNLDDLDVIADMDELLEAMATDPAAYAFWATEEFAPDPESRISALFAQYAEQLGESAPSTT